MNMNMYKTKKNEMPVAGDPTMLLVDNYLSTRQMLSNLIEMYRMESQLKKHHKAYLHVREKADMMCDFYEVLLAEMDGREKVMFDKVQEQAVVGEGNRRENPCEGCTECCGACMELEESLPSAGEDEAEVIMLMGTYETMQDDMICLGEGIDLMVEAMQTVLAGQPVSKTTLEQVCSMVTEMSDEICDRWSEMEE